MVYRPLLLTLILWLSVVHNSLRSVHESLAQERQKLQEAWNNGELPASSQHMASLLEVRTASSQSAQTQFKTYTVHCTVAIVPLSLVLSVFCQVFCLVNLTNVLRIRGSHCLSISVWHFLLSVWSHRSFAFPCIVFNTVSTHSRMEYNGKASLMLTCEDICSLAFCFYV